MVWIHLHLFRWGKGLFRLFDFNFFLRKEKKGREGNHKADLAMSSRFLIQLNQISHIFGETSSSSLKRENRFGAFNRVFLFLFSPCNERKELLGSTIQNSFFFFKEELSAMKTIEYNDSAGLFLFWMQ